jgi:hypothetical protein
MAENPQQQIPTVIFFVWLGGDLPPERKTNVERWKTLHPDFTVEIWIDSRWKDPKGTVENGTHKITAWAHSHSIVVRDVKEHPQGNSPHYLKEVGLQPRSAADKPWSNFGTASDLFRYYQLLQEGGIYADSDLPFVDHTNIQIDLNGLNTRIQDATGNQGNAILQVFLHQRNPQTVSTVTNDLMASPPGNRALAGLIHYCHGQLDQLYADPERLREYPSTEGGLQGPRSIETQSTTGPESVRFYLFNKYQGKIPARCVAYSYPALHLPAGSSIGSAQSWNIS